MKKRGFTAGLCTGVMLLCGISAGAADLTAQLSQQPIYVEGERVWDVTAYDIGGNNYVKLRDMGMSVGFDVVYDASTDSVHIDPTIAYSGNPETYLDVEIPKTASAKLSQQPIYVNGKRVEITAYDIGGSNYMKLRDIGTAVGFGVTYDAGTDSVHIDPTTPYRESIKKQSYASDPEQTPPQDDFMGYATDEDAIDAIFKRAAEETEKARLQREHEGKMSLEEEADAVENVLVDNPVGEAHEIEAVLKLVNEAREAEGVAPLTLDDDLCKAAQIRAKEIEDLYSHTRPDSRKFSTVLDDNNITWMTAAENITASETPDGAMESWMNSDGHRKNILNARVTKIGVARYKFGWIQLFIG